MPTLNDRRAAAILRDAADALRDGIDPLHIATVLCDASQLFVDWDGYVARHPDLRPPKKPAALGHQEPATSPATPGRADKKVGGVTPTEE